MMKQIFSRLKASKSTDKEIIGGSMPSGLNPFSDSVTADSSRQPPTLSATGLSYERRGDNVGLTNLHINDALFSSSFQPLLPSFRDVPSTEKQSLLMQKLNLCCTLFDFTDPTTDVKEKTIKKQTLQEIVQYIVSANGNGKFPADIVAAITVMVSSNIFRSLRSPPREKKVIQVFDLEDDEPSRDPAWPHLQFVYQLFLKFIESPGTDAKLAKRYINHYFIRELLELFNTEDPRERDYLKTVLHRVYGKFMVYRPFIRRSINNIFYQFIYETEKHNGIAELLEIFGSIINGFALPLKEEHKLFLVRTLIPLHKPRSLSTYHEQLSCCVTQFVEKDCKLADTVIRGLVKYWPISNSPKEGLFLEELAGILSVTQLAEFQRCMVPLFYQIARCLSSSQFQVAERTVCLWNNYHIEALFNEHIKEMLPIILPALEENANRHWNQRVQNLSLGLRTLLSDRDPELFAECLQQYEEGKVKQEGLKQQREAAWKCLDDMASTKVTAGEAVLVSPALLPQSSLI